jgi:hypothetical protein
MNKKNKPNRHTHGSSCLGFFVKRNVKEKRKKEQSTPQTTQKKLIEKIEPSACC